MVTLKTALVIGILLVGSLFAGCTTQNSNAYNQSESPVIQTTTSNVETLPTLKTGMIPCGMNMCTPTEECCNGFCIDPTSHVCCAGKPCQGSCCNVSGTERCIDPTKQTCCGNNVCNLGQCCAGSCMPPGQYFCVYVNGTGCYGLPDYLKCVWEGDLYEVVRTNVPYGEIDPSYLDIIIKPAAGDKQNISEYWVIPAIGGGGRELAHRVSR